MVTPRKIVWDIKARDNFKKLIQYIKEQNATAAPKVRQAIFDNLRAVSENPFVFEADRFKVNNSGEYRAFERYQIRVTYKAENHRIIVLRVRHTSQNPVTY